MRKIECSVIMFIITDSVAKESRWYWQWRALEVSHKVHTGYCIFKAILIEFCSTGMDTKSAKSLISVSQIIENSWFFTFATALAGKFFWLRIRIWKFQNMLGKVQDEISPFPEGFPCCRNFSIQFSGVQDREFQNFLFWRRDPPY